MAHSGKKLYLIHGWAANRHIFDGWAAHFPGDWQITALNLPGHGGAPFDGVFDVAAAADGLAAQMDDGALVLGWSLGGLAALFLAARHPRKVRGLCLCASFAKFLAAEDYPEGLAPTSLVKMADCFEQDYHKYMQQFVQMQFLYAKERQAAVMAQLFPALTAGGAPAALRAALDGAAHADARGLLADICVPVLLVYGGKDRITPVRLGEYLQRHLPDARLEIIGQAAHAPFLSHADGFAALLAGFAQTRVWPQAV
ncbi:pimeloyl-ACP methyl ester esterase BioH [Neisseria leonii]|uniref:Pimeloyl-ACP methyl ester esterase BioH n=1 Tax=Neisseria leonii TaxID=2995413 RepID=A0A9X4IAZ4_9NEIS|nr:pimeloyl-ACP methyl ester esterase BioH [Neisseria sp. 51.81]MDD9327879.1 pimeloyl-ACP methyl ester esterase BioH [Neisseria sp. 51.81]